MIYQGIEHDGRGDFGIVLHTLPDVAQVKLFAGSHQGIEKERLIGFLFGAVAGLVVVAHQVETQVMILPGKSIIVQPDKGDYLVRQPPDRNGRRKGNGTGIHLMLPAFGKQTGFQLIQKNFPGNCFAGIGLLQIRHIV